MALPLPKSLTPLVSSRDRQRQRYLLQSQLFDAWLHHRRLDFAGTANLCALGWALLVLALEVAICGTEALRRYAILRLLGFVALGLPYLLYRRYRSPSWQSLYGSLYLIYPLLLLNGLGAYFVLRAAASAHNDLMVSAVLSVVFSYGLVYRFLREQLALTTVAGAGLGLCSALLPELRADCLDLAVAYGAALAGTLFFRSEFAAGLYERYVTTSSILPVKVARYLTVHGGGDDTLMLLFGPKIRFVVCLYAEWRGYEQAGSPCSPEETVRLFEAFYEHAILTLEQTVPSGAYYADWNACDLFVTFYSERDEAKDVISSALTFAKALSQTASPEIEQQTGCRVLFDVGIAAGSGLFGVQGPPHQRKATVAAEFAGRARQLEMMASQLRQDRLRTPPTPILMMDAELSARVTGLGITPATSNEVIAAGNKSGEGAVCIAWQEREFKATSEEWVAA